MARFHCPLPLHTGDVLTLPPSAALRPETRVHKRVAGLLHALRAAGVDSRGALAGRWQVDPGFLRPEVALWVQTGGETALERVWTAALEEAGERGP
jgi:hypothetical protein